MNNSNSAAFVRLIALSIGFASAGFALLTAGDALAQPAAPATGTSYPAPRFPSYLRTPDSVDEVMPIARRLVRELKGLQGDGLGIAQSGDTVAVISNADSQDVFIEALRRAMPSAASSC